MASKNKAAKVAVLALIVSIPVLLGIGASYDKLSPREWAIGMVAWFAMLVLLQVIVRTSKSNFLIAEPTIPVNDPKTRRRISRGIWRRKVWIAALAVALPVGIAKCIAARAWLPMLCGVGINLLCDVRRNRRNSAPKAARAVEQQKSSQVNPSLKR